MFFQCTECIFGTNSPRQADRHSDDTGHEVIQEDD
jgi:hypothetical protein